MNMTCEGLIRLSFSKKRPKNEFPYTRGAGYLCLSQCTVAPTALWKCFFWGTLYMWRVDRWNILHALSLKMARCFASLFSRHISQTFHSQRFKIQQNHQTHYAWSECQPQIELKYFLFVSYVKMYSICQITTAARVCHGFAKDVAIIHSNCYLNLQWGEGVMLNTYQQALSSASYS